MSSPHSGKPSSDAKEVTSIKCRNQKQKYMTWTKGQPVKVYSQSQESWCPGEIASITQDEEGYCLDVRYWSGNTSKAKFLDPVSTHLRSIDQAQCRQDWTTGSKVQCWSNGRSQWFDAEILDILHYPDEPTEEWLKVQWHSKDPISNQSQPMSKEVSRGSYWVRFRYPELESELPPEFDEFDDDDETTSEESHEDDDDESTSEERRDQLGELPPSMVDLEPGDIGEINLATEVVEDVPQQSVPADWAEEKEELLYQIETLEKELQDEQETSGPLLQEIEKVKLKASTFRCEAEKLRKQLKEVLANKSSQARRSDEGDDAGSVHSTQSGKSDNPAALASQRIQAARSDHRRTPSDNSSVTDIFGHSEESVEAKVDSDQLASHKYESLRNQHQKLQEANKTLLSKYSGQSDQLRSQKKEVKILREEKAALTQQLQKAEEVSKTRDSAQSAPTRSNYSDEPEQEMGVIYKSKLVRLQREVGDYKSKYEKALNDKKISDLRKEELVSELSAQKHAMHLNADRWKRASSANKMVLDLLKACIALSNKAASRSNPAKYIPQLLQNLQSAQLAVAQVSENVAAAAEKTRRASRSGHKRLTANGKTKKHRPQGSIEKPVPGWDPNQATQSVRISHSQRRMASDSVESAGLNRTNSSSPQPIITRPNSLSREVRLQGSGSGASYGEAPPPPPPTSSSRFTNVPMPVGSVSRSQFQQPTHGHEMGPDGLHITRRPAPRLKGGYPHGAPARRAAGSSRRRRKKESIDLVDDAVESNYSGNAVRSSVAYYEDDSRSSQSRSSHKTSKPRKQTAMVDPYSKISRHNLNENRYGFDDRAQQRLAVSKEDEGFLSANLSVKWPRRNSLMKFGNKYERTTVSESSSGIQLSSTKGGQQANLLEWGSINDIQASGRALVIIQTDGNRTKIKLNDPDEALRWKVSMSRYWQAS